MLRTIMIAFAAASLLGISAASAAPVNGSAITAAFYENGALQRTAIIITGISIGIIIAAGGNPTAAALLAPQPWSGNAKNLAGFGRPGSGQPRLHGRNFSSRRVERHLLVGGYCPRGPGLAGFPDRLFVSQAAAVSWRRRPSIIHPPPVQCCG